MKDEGPLHPPPDVLVDYAEGNVRDLRWKEHIDRCGTCSAEVDNLKETIALARDVDVPEPAEAYWRDFGSRLDERLRKEGKGRRRVRRWLLVAAAALLAVGFLAIQNRLSITSAPPDTAETVLPPVDEDVEFQLLLSFAELFEGEENWEELLDFGPDPDLDPTQLTAEEREQLRQKLERDLEGGNHALS